MSRVIAICALLAAIGATAAGAVARPSATGAGASGLVARLAVLRRAQTPDDALPSGVRILDPQGTVLPAFTRHVGTLPDGRKLYLVVVRPSNTPDRLWGPRFGDQVAVAWVTPQGVLVGRQLPAAALGDADEVSYAGEPVQAGSPNRLAAVGIVPDGVASVRWTFGRLDGRVTRTVSESVADNVALTPVTPATLFLLRGTWFNASGAVIPTSQAAVRRALAAENAAKMRAAVRAIRRHPVHASSRLLAAFAVFAVHSRHGIRMGDGDVVSAPRLEDVPLPILEIASAGPGAAHQDPQDVREVRTRSGYRVWILPTSRGICVAEIDPAPRNVPLDEFGQGSGEACDDQIKQAVAEGAGVSVGDPGQRTVVYGVVPIGHGPVTEHLGHGRKRIVNPDDGVYVYATGPVNHSGIGTSGSRA